MLPGEIDRFPRIDLRVCEPGTLRFLRLLPSRSGRRRAKTGWVGISPNHQNRIREAESGETKEGHDDEEELAERERMNAN